jgi:formylmethanofuran dehydrogenase subunit E
MESLLAFLERSASRHTHLCPRQVLGVRMGLAGLSTLGLEAPLTKPTGLVIVESDGCFVDGVEVACGATIGHRTLRLQDFGKIAATFVDAKSGRAIRISAKPDARSRAGQYAPKAADRYAAQLQGYQLMPEGELLQFQDVILQPALDALLSRPDARACCEVCGEEIINERQVKVAGAVLCRTCAGQGYYALQGSPIAVDMG